MRLSDWAAVALDGSPPPIPFETDVVNSTNDAYRVGAIPVQALADDLAASGLTYSPGRGHGYRLHGDRVDSYAVGDLLAALFDDAAEVLAFVLDTDDRVDNVRAAEKALGLVPVAARTSSRRAEFDLLARRLQDARDALPADLVQLEQARSSLAATARSIRGILYVRNEAIRRFRPVIPAPPRERDRPASAAEVAAFLASVPPGPIDRRDLHADATDAGLIIGPRTLYKAADALGWPRVTRKGWPTYLVPPIPAP